MPEIVNDLFIDRKIDSRDVDIAIEMARQLNPPERYRIASGYHVNLAALLAGNEELRNTVVNNGPGWNGRLREAILNARLLDR